MRHCKSGPLATWQPLLLPLPQKCPGDFGYCMIVPPKKIQTLLDIFLEVERVGDYINLHFVVKKQWCLRLKKVFRNIDRWKCLWQKQSKIVDVVQVSCVFAMVFTRKCFLQPIHSRLAESFAPRNRGCRRIVERHVTWWRRRPMAVIWLVLV